MNKFRLLQSLKLQRLEDIINEFGAQHELLSVSIFRSADVFVAGVTYREPVVTEMPKNPVEITLSYALEFKNIRLISESDGIRALTKDKMYCVGGNGSYPMYHSAEEAIEALVKHIEEERNCNVELIGNPSEIENIRGH